MTSIFLNTPAASHKNLNKKVLLAPRLTFCFNLPNWNALFLLNYVWQLGGETGLLNHLLAGFQWDWLILQMSLKQCKHCYVVHWWPSGQTVYKAGRRESGCNWVCTQANLQILVDSDRACWAWKWVENAKVYSGCHPRTMQCWLNESRSQLFSEWDHLWW